MTLISNLNSIKDVVMSRHECFGLKMHGRRLHREIYTLCLSDAERTILEPPKGIDTYTIPRICPWRHLSHPTCLRMKPDIYLLQALGIRPKERAFSVSPRGLYGRSMFECGVRSISIR